MNCRAANRLYVRANGTVPCNCDIGENITLFSPDIADLVSFDYDADCYNGKPFRAMRASFSEGRPYLSCCESCYFFSPGDDFEHAGEDGRLLEIENLQIESSFLCALDCEACVRRNVRTDPERSPLGDGPYNMPLELFQKLVDGLAAGGVRVGEFTFCGRGEPLLHPQFTELITYARTVYPDSLYSVVTSGNLRFTPGLLLVDYLTVSIDGAYPDSYKQYRVGGDIAIVYQFLEDVIRHRKPEPSAASPPIPDLRQQLLREGRPIVQWKYLLFEHNDSDDELVFAQEKALELGVDQMMFAFSHTWNRSKKYTSEEQIRELELFQVFDKKRVFYSNVNEEAGNVEYWETEEHRKKLSDR